ncbi:hypothetical protein [Streptomyces sp. NPDC090025]|uniref:allene oxide cyclase barrel-like domain-containing protein n=1 Tax=Streptomyces sp. NPDC090025 TaxID=3365922 RepID=UPI003837A470
MIRSFTRTGGRRAGRLARLGALGVSTVAVVTLGAAAPASAAAADDGDGFEFTLYAKEVPAPGTSASPSDSSSESASPSESASESASTSSESAAPPAPKVGDTFTFADDLYRTKGGDPVGRDGVTCSVVRVSGDSADAACVGTFVLDGGPGGQLAAQGLTTMDTTEPQAAAFDVAVTGGTGDFKNAHGYIRVTPDGDYERMEFHITTR